MAQSISKREYVSAIQRATWEQFESAERPRYLPLLRRLEEAPPTVRAGVLRLLANRASLQRSPATYRSRAERASAWRAQQAVRLATLAGVGPDEHGSTYTRGDHFSARGLDYVPAWAARTAPYLDAGGEGIGLVALHRKRVYAKSSKWFPADTEDRYLVGRNEAGTYFAHPVPRRVSTLREAVDWIWSGLADRIIGRQGDIALVEAAGPKMPAQLPARHTVTANAITHPTHAALPLPGKGQRIISARRAVTFAANGTRD